MTEPLLKWVGGKRRLIKRIEPLLPKMFNAYHEPFFGGGALFFHIKPKASIISDVNNDLMLFYSVLRDKPEDVFYRLQLMFHSSKGREEAYYYEVRNDKTLDDVEFASNFMYLNKCGFNGLYRLGKNGRSNVSFGKRIYKSFPYKYEDFIEASTTLKAAKLSTCSGFKTVLKAEHGDFVYFDPPYDSSTPCYGTDRFTSQNQIELALMSRVLADRGVHVMISNAKTELIESLYKGFNFTELTVSHDVGWTEKNAKKKKATELIITSY